MASSYTAKDILVLEGLEPVRRRPGMYIGGVDAAGLHHLIWELVDNSVDEAMNGHADRITVTLHKDGASATVADNGRGIPVDRHAQYKKPALELILTTLHAGGKFEAKNYYHSGGLHGVGASVVTALAESLVARVRRDGSEWEQRFSRGKVASPLRKVGAARGRGTTICFRPDTKIFPDVRFDPKRIAELLEAKAYLHGGLTVEFVDEHTGTRALYHYEEGLRAYLTKIIAERGAAPLAGEVFTIQKEQDGLHLDCALAWTEATEERVLSYVNSIPTTSGGAHENGLRAGLAKAVRNYLTVHNLVPRGITIAAEDVREGLVAVLAIKIPQPQFQGQTKERLNNTEVTPLIDGIVRSALENALNGRRRHREGLRPGQAPLPQDLPPHGRRLGREPHLHAAAHLLLSPPPRADPPGLRLHRAAAALPHRRRQGGPLGARRCGEGAPAGRTEWEPRHAAGAALQGPRRDEPLDAQGDDARPRAPRAAAGRDPRRRPDRADHPDAHGPRGRAALRAHHGARAEGGRVGRLGFPRAPGGAKRRERWRVASRTGW